MDTEGALTAGATEEGIEMASWWEYQLPIRGNYLRMKDDERYWNDYYHNTGFKPRYPGRSYANYGNALFNEVKGDILLGKKLL